MWNACALWPVRGLINPSPMLINPSPIVVSIFLFMLDARSPKPAPLLESSDLLRPQLETISFMEPLEIVDTVARLLSFLFQIQKTTFR